MKNKFAVFFFVLLFSVFCGVSVYADTDGKLNYSVSGTNATITGYTKELPSEVVIPETIGGGKFTVTSISDYAFTNCKTLTKITVPNTVTSIGKGAFYGCTALEEMTLPFVGKKETAISDAEKPFGYIFDYTRSMEDVSGAVKQGKDESHYNNCYYYYIPSRIKKVTITNDVTISDYAFHNCKSITDVILGEKTTAVGSYAFQFCSNLANISLSNNIKNVGSYAFNECRALVNVNLPQNLTCKYEHAFEGCTRLSSISLPDSLTTMEDYAFARCAVSSIVIPENITSISNHAFSGCSSLKDVILPDNITSIGDYAFYGCTALSKAIIPDTTTYLGEYCFYNCTSVASVSIGMNTAAIKDYTFYNCKSLATVVVGSKVESIGDYAFYNAKLTRVALPTSLISVGNYAFKDNLSLTRVQMRNNVRTIGEGAFYNCKALYQLTYPTALTTIGDYAFYNCEALTAMEVSKGVTVINNSVFENCKFLATVQYLGKITSIGQAAFYGCAGLEAVYVEEGISSIDNYVFYGCLGLKKAVLPSDISYIGEDTFYGCDDLTIYCSNNDYVADYADFNWINYVDTSVISSMELTPPTKLSYLIGEELNLDGMVATVTYGSGDVDTITYGYTVSGFDSSVSGKQRVTVKYKNSQDYFDVDVLYGNVTALVVTPPLRVIYAEGQQADFSDMVVKVVLDDGTEQIVTDGYTVSGFDSSAVGTNIITVTYGNASSKFKVEIIKGVVSAVTLEDPDGVLFVSCGATANFGDAITVSINAQNNKKYKIVVKNAFDEVIKTVYSNTCKLIMPEEDIVISAEYVGYETGDVNLDGFVDNADSAIILRHTSGIGAITGELKLCLADINNDNLVDLNDAILCLSK